MSVAEPIIESPVVRESDYVWTLNFGPQHPATHTTLRIVLKLDGERVIDAVPDIGYLHSGFEKTGEHLNYNQYVTITDRMNYISPVANGIAWHAAVEKLLGIEITPRCKYIRTIVAELARISDHLLCTGAMGLDTGAFTFFLYAFYQREVIYDIFETISGQRFHPSMTRVGGLAYDFTPLVIEKIRTFAKNFPQTLDDMERLLNRNRIFVDRTKGVGILSKERATNMSATGPIARASGVTRDLRKDEPHLAYPDLDFQVCCAKAGDCFARYYVRMAEMRELKDRRSGHRKHSRRPAQRRHRRADDAAAEEPGLSNHRRHHHALRAGHVESRLRRAQRRNVRGH